jgi:hypothetical protein
MCDGRQACLPCRRHVRWQAGVQTSCAWTSLPGVEIAGSRSDDPAKTQIGVANCVLQFIYPRDGTSSPAAISFSIAVTSCGLIIDFGDFGITVALLSFYWNNTPRSSKKPVTNRQFSVSIPVEYFLSGLIVSVHFISSKRTVYQTRIKYLAYTSWPHRSFAGAFSSHDP